jgi:Tfp pilus assembly protein PilN
MVDLHKEIKLSDLFKRGPKEPGEPKAEKPPKEKRPKKEKPPKERRPSRFKRAKEPIVAAHEAPPLLEIPLMRAFNLLPSEEARSAQEKRSPVPYVLVALVGVLLFAALAAFYLMAGAGAAEKQSRIDDLRAELAVYAAQVEKPKADDPAQALAAERLGRTNALSAALETRLAWDRVLRELALVLPEDAAVDLIEATSPGAFNAPTPVSGSPTVHFTMLGGTDSHASVAEVLARLSVIPEFENVNLKLSQRTDPDAVGSSETRHPYTFQITATLRLG